MLRRWRGGPRISLWNRRLQAVAARGVARIAISGGSTPKAAFATLAEQGEEWRERMPWDKLDLWWVDERCVPPDDAESNYRMTREALLDHVPLKPEQIHRMEGELEPDDAAARYEADLRKRFGLTGAETPRFDLVQLGIGPDGHTASLFPHTDALRVVDRLVTANYVEKLDMWRVTLTWPVINHARQVFFLIAGTDKAHDPKRGIGGTARSGASAEPVHRACERYTDVASGSGCGRAAARAGRARLRSNRED